MPATGTPEPGGLDWRTLTRFLRKAARSRKILGFDVVELAPIPGWVAPDFLAAKLIYRFLGEIFGDSLRPGGKPPLAKEK
jgi:agmatinase